VKTNIQIKKQIKDVRVKEAHMNTIKHTQYSIIKAHYPF